MAMRRRNEAMGWFSDLCRNVGLMVHHARHPEGHKPPERKTIRKDVHEERKGNMILRRTTIEEVEIRPDDSKKE